MGLDFSHCDAHWSYGGFNRFRARLAKEIGMDLDKMDGFKSGGIPWSKFNDAILPLLNHSDCDGELTPSECKKIAPRLKAIVDLWDDDDYDKQHALLLVEGMEEAVENNEPLEFK